jgi:hypothetical protein
MNGVTTRMPLWQPFYQLVTAGSIPVSRITIKNKYEIFGLPFSQSPLKPLKTYT